MSDIVMRHTNINTGKASMPNNYKVANDVLKDATRAINEGADKHGDTERSFTMIAQMWSTYLSHAFTARKGVVLRPHDVARMMEMLKMARSMYGHSMDNFVDSAGYAAIAAMLSPLEDLPSELEKAVADELGRLNDE